MEIGTEAPQSLFWEYINRNFFAVWGPPPLPYLSGGHERVLDAGLPRGGRTVGVARGIPVRARLYCTICPKRAYLSRGHERVLDAGLPRGGRTVGFARGVPVRARLYYVLNGRTCPEVMSVYLTQVCPVVGVQKGSHGGFLSAQACTMS